MASLAAFSAAALAAAVVQLRVEFDQLGAFDGKLFSRRGELTELHGQTRGGPG